jgi:hypothetical protein
MGIISGFYARGRRIDEYTFDLLVKMGQRLDEPDDKNYLPALFNAIQHAWLTKGNIHTQEVRFLLEKKGADSNVVNSENQNIV